MAGFRTLARLAPLAAAGALALGGCGEPQTGGTAQTGQAPAADAAEDRSEALAALSQRLAALEAEVIAAEDVSAVKRLTRTYSYYLDRGLWADLTGLMTEDARGSYPAGVFIGKDSLAPHFLENNGRGHIGFEEGRLGNHIALQPVVTLREDGTAAGRWRVLAQLGQYGESASWAGGVYENVYRKEDGVWKISGLRYYGGFSGPYETGWAGTPGDAPRPGAATFRNLPHPADEPAETDCQGYPTGTCIPPFSFDNPGSGRPWQGLEASQAQSAPVQPAREIEVGAVETLDFEAAAARAQNLRARAERLEDERAIENLMRSYGFYVDRKMWDDAADLFARTGSFEVGQRGVYEGRDSIRRAMEAFWGPQDLQRGQINDHMVLQPVIHVAPDGRSAQGRFRHIGMLGEYEEWGRWEDGVYENFFVKEDGVWKIAALHLYTILSTDIEQGWAESAFPADGPSAEAPPDAPPTVVYENYPTYFTPPFHYPNPATGEAVTYREGDAGAAVRVLGPDTSAPMTDAPAPATLEALEAAVAEAEARVARVTAANALNDLINAYGYYLDKGLYNELADLFAEDGSMELAQRGVYQGRERVRQFLQQGLNRGQPDGPRPGFLQDHVQLQAVIHVAEDAQTATARMRMIQMMGFAGQSASWGAGVYVDDFVKEDGRWKFRTAHAYNTFNAAYDGAWVRNAGGALPGQNPDLPPDAPPTLEFTYYPDVYDIPFNYDNPVSGRAPYSYRD